jgi:hypothetical protein
MNYMDKLKAEFAKVAADFSATPVMQRIASGQFTKAHYASLLKEVSHYTREDPQMQALTAVYFRGTQRELVKAFFKHATSEIGHDQLALNDLATLGFDASRVPLERPLPTTMALIAFSFYQIQFLNPVGFLGYLFFLEFLPTTSGEGYKKLLMRVGIPEEALTFLSDHTVVDQGHNRLMETYVEKLVTTPEEFESVVYSLRVTGKLYGAMFQGAFDQVDNPRDFGLSSDELQFARKGPPVGP